MGLQLLGLHSLCSRPLYILFSFRYFTRFTEEAFAALVGLIFIVESLKKIFSKWKILEININSIYFIFEN